jgi:dihydrofolate synthase / folylpolyglutamate synthase
MTAMEYSSRRERAVAFLMSRIDYEKAISISYSKQEFHLDRMRELLAQLGNPQERLKIIHVAGTKGKGSTSAMIAAALSAAGYRCGLYTSPHLDRLEERIMVDGRACSEAEFVALVEKVRPIVEQLDAKGRLQNPVEPGPTYFETITAMAFVHFAAIRTDAAVVEVGLGGRLDSTNVCQPLISVITSISFDHTELLGTTLAAIAREKAGIIKPNVTVVSGVIEEEPSCVISEIAHQNQCQLIQLGIDFSYEYHPPRELDRLAAQAYGTIDYENHSNGRMCHMQGVELGLIGRHQAINASVALTVLNELSHRGWKLQESVVRRGLANLKWPGRVEIVARRPTVVLDAAHNAASIQCLLNTLDESFEAPRRLLIFAATQGKDVRGMLQLLLPHFEAVILTQYWKNPRAVRVKELNELVAELSEIPRFVCDDPAAAWHRARELATPDHLVCVTGSLFLTAEMRAEILRRLVERVEEPVVQKT